METRLLIIRALTPLHVGSGRGESEYVDLPIQRDEFDFPTIWASSLKGALRANYNQNDKNLIFGPDPESRTEVESSAASFLDARLFLVPARTLTNIWTYITSPHMLERLNIYLSLVNKQIQVVDTSEKVVLSRRDLLTGINKTVVNEEELDAEVKEGITEGFKTFLPNDILNLVNKKGLAIIPDSLSKSLIDRSILIQYRIRLNNQTKTISTGSLWSEEYLPADSVLASLIVCKDKQVKKDGNPETISAQDICKSLENFFNNKSIVIGGKETIGKGLVKLYIIR